MLSVQAACAREAGEADCVEGRRIRWVVGWTPGGGFDAYSRLAQPFIERELRADVVIDNVPGAGGRVGALTIAKARPDGLTLGILNGSGFLWSGDAPDSDAPDLRDFTLLARVSARQQVIVTSGKSGVTTLDELLALSRTRPIVMGATAPDSANFASLAVIIDLFGLPARFVTGYPGSRELTLGLLRGDCDVTSLDSESLLDLVETDAVHPVLSITPEHSADVRLDNVPYLTGDGGVIRSRPELFVRASADPAAITDGMSAYLTLGRLFAGPAGMPEPLRDCIEAGILAALNDPGFADAAGKAGRSIGVMSGAAVRTAIPSMIEAVRPIAPIIAEAAGRLR